jgi:lipid-binding SYLF domain-containing protein
MTVIIRQAGSRRIFNNKEVDMKTATILAILITLVAVGPGAGTALGDEYANAISVFQSSPQVQPFFENAYGYAVFPTVAKAAFVVGGAFGEGRVYRAGKATGTANLVHASIGWQLGGKAYSEIVFFQDKRAYDTFTSGEFAFDAQAEAVAVTAGAQAKASTAGSSASATAGPKTGAQAQTKWKNGMATFVHHKGGLLGALALGGQKFSFEPLP